LKIAIFSDLHLEFYDDWLFDSECWATKSWADDVDLAIIAGDLCEGSTLKTTLNRVLPPRLPAVFVPGNHEYYECRDFYAAREHMGRACFSAGATFLENSSVEMDDIRIIGSTLWYNECIDALNDARLIPAFDTIIYDLHALAKASLHRMLCEKDHRKTIVVTHHAPIPQMSRPEHRNSAINRAFVPNMKEFMDENLLPDIWISGHTHHRADVEHLGCRFITHAAGYPGEMPLPYEPLVIEV